MSSSEDSATARVVERGRPKVLFLAHRLPFPPDSGGAIKRWRVVEFLARNYELGAALVCPQEDLRYKDAFLSRVGLAALHVETLNRRRSAANLLRSWVRGMPLAVYRNYSEPLAARMRKIARDYDVLYLDSFFILPHVPADFEGRVVLHAHNAETLIWERYTATAGNPFKKAVVGLETGRVRRYEREAGLRADRVLAAPHDQDFLRHLGIPGHKFLDTFHLGDDAQLGQPDIDFAATEASLLYIGSLDWEPNLDGLVWFLNEVWEGLKARHPPLQLHVLGRNPGQRLKRAAEGRAGVLFHGFVENLEPYYARSRLFIAPLRFGGGMKVKIINAMYRGIPVVTTPVGAEGLEVDDMRHLSVSADAAKMQHDMHTLLEDGTVWRRMRDASRRHARERFSWERVYGPLRRAIEEA